ncbi:H/ACA ribonucleoprotein complex non-core subunit NAF1 [Pseudocercospora fuligena]|uniref:H/ACA ribonucleoprotein complex non-core subunit NAF1 n=1 Tax=Pseudocercospora fuligena TaxID=685502 RepID=A0A8H6RF30_9PEZI|nr:H/ACA ribonucleoprotein complex non-core subunit NAF1 [Pseudocercospora fuligena]
MADPVEEHNLYDPDEARPVKRVRLEAALEVTTETRDEMEDDDNWDDVYGADSPAQNQNHTGVAAPVKQPEIADPTVNATTSAIPASKPQPSSSALDNGAQPASAEQLPDGVPPEAISQGDDLVAPPTQPTVEPQEERVFEETTAIERELPESHAQDGQAIGGALRTETTEVDVPMLDTDGLIARPKVTEDVEFMAAAAAQHGSKEAEWQFDESDAESSSDSDTSSDSSDDSDSGSDEGYEMLDPATAAKILMSGEGDDDGEKRGGKSGADHQPRTANEVKEEIVPKPDVTITPETKLTLLGRVDKTVENMALIKGDTPGEYQVLETGSVLCNEQRQVIGAVADTFGRVQEPLYSVAFTNQKEIEELGLEHGAKVFYVDSHSTFVFTQPLKNLKGTDASNIHDEEVNEDEMEFSDDEKEAEYKRQKKLAKRGGKAAFSRSDFNQGKTFSTPTNEYQPSYIRGNDAPSQSYGGGGLSYDDDEAEATGGFYEPLKRPDNLDQLMGAPRPPPQQSFDRGRGRGRGDRGRGDRGRGDRGRGDRGRGRGDRGRGRGGFNQRGGSGGQHQPQQGSSQHAQPRQPSYSQPDTASSSAAPYQQYGQYQGAPSTYVFNGQTYQYNAQQYPAPAGQPQYYGQQPSASAPLPPGTYVSPAFYQQQVQTSQQQQPYAGWQGQYNQAYAGAPAPHQAQASGQQGPDIGAILQNLQQQNGQR